MIKEIEKNVEPVFIIFLVVLGLFYIYLAFNTKMLGEDESTYFYVGKEISKGNLPLFIVNLPLTIPFFVPLTYSIPFILFGSSLALTKAITAIFGILTILTVYMIGKKVNIWFGIFSALLLLSLPFFSHFSLISYVEIPIAFFSAIIVYILLSMKNYKDSILAGVMLFLSFFTKASGLVLIATALIYTVFFYLAKKDKKYFKLVLIAVVISLIFSSALALRNLGGFHYPFVEGLNLFFELPKQYESPSWISGITKTISQKVALQDYISLFGIVLFLLIIFGFSYFIEELPKSDDKNIKLFLMTSIIFLVFLVLFIYLSSTTGGDPRYFSIVFPQIALIGGYFLYQMKEKNKYLTVIVALIIIYSIYTGISVAITTSTSVRYPDNYVEALTWLNKNTPEKSLIFTTYGGSVRYFAERDSIWASIKEFPDIMRSSNSSYIHDTLKNYNVSYILVWRPLLSQDIVVPESNIIGVFTYNFLNEVINNTEHFKVAYQNDDNIIFELL